MIAQNGPSTLNTSTYNFWNTGMQSIALPGSTESWILLKSDFQMNNNNFFNQEKATFGLSLNETLNFHETTIISPNYYIKKFKHYYNGIEIENSGVIAHIRNNKFSKLNTKIYRFSNLSSTSSVSESTALNTALNYINSNNYIWNNTAYLSMHKLSYQDAFPTGKLVFRNINGSFFLCWKFDIKTLDATPIDKTIYVNAQTNLVVFELTHVHQCNSINTTIVNTPHVSSADIEVSNGVLHDNCRNIETQLLITVNTTSGDSIIYIPINSSSSNNIYKTAHWSAKKAYDYYETNFGWSSYTGQNDSMKVNINLLDSTYNAFWYRNEGIYLPYHASTATLDIMGHEFTHGVIQSSSDLEYFGESGALNESFADIFGNLVEQYADSVKMEYKLAEDMQLISPLAPSYFRDMQNPSSLISWTTGLPYPDTYLNTAAGWYDLSLCNPNSLNSPDKCGVHTNSSVMNYWFYLITEGTNGQTLNNANGDSYNINIGLGPHTSGEIAFRTMLTLFPDANFKETAENSLWNTIELHGFCSDEFNVVFEAWVGVGVLLRADLALFQPLIEAIGPNCGLSYNGQISVPVNENLTYNYRLEGPSGTISGTTVPPQNTIFIDSLPIGDYELTILDSLAVPASCFPSPIDFNLVQQNMSINVETIDPCGNNLTGLSKPNGQIYVEVIGGVPPYTYSWTDSSGSISNGFNPYTSTQLSLVAGTYFLEVTDANACIFQDTIVLSISDLAVTYTLTPNTNPLDCADDSVLVQIYPTGGQLPYVFYSWYNQSLYTHSGSTQSNIATLGAGTYSLGVGDGWECSAGQVLNLKKPPFLEIEDSVVNASCSGGTNGEIYLNIIGNTTTNPVIEWLDNGSDDNPRQNLGIGVYKVHLTDTCTNTDIIYTYTINEGNMTIDIVNMEFPSCSGDLNGLVDIAVSGSNNYTFEWQNANGNTIANTQNINNLAAGDYNLSLTNNSGCKSILNVKLLGSAPLIVDILDFQNPLCHLDTNGFVKSIVSGGFEPYTYTWTELTSSNNFNTKNINNSNAGTYTLLLTDSNACSVQSDTVSLEDFPELIVTDSITTAMCSNGAITITVSGGTGPGTYSYDWILTGDTTQSLNNINGGTHVLFISDSNNCSQNKPYFVQEINTINIKPSIIHNNCFGDSMGSISMQVLGALAPYTIEWEDSTNANPRQNLSAGTYTVTILDANGCSRIESYTITEPTEITISNTLIQTSAFCTGNIDTILLDVSGGTGSLSYSWSDANDNIVGSSQDLIVAADGIYTLSITDANGCLKQNVPISTTGSTSTLSISSISTNPTCTNSQDGSITINATGGTSPYSYSIDGGASYFINQASFNNLPGGIYDIMVTDTNGCASAIQTVTLIIAYPFPSGLITESGPVQTTTTNWTSSRNVIGDITVPNGFTLNITGNVDIYFDANTGIIVERGGVLNIDNSKLTTVCPKSFWNGVSTSDFPLTVADAPTIAILNGAIIEYAHIGLRTETSSVVKTFPPKAGLPNLDIQNSTFKDCHIGMQIGKSGHGFVNFEGFGIPASVIIQWNTFECNQVLPDATYAGKGTETFIEKYGYSSESIENNIFVNSATNINMYSKPNGIVTNGGFSGYRNFSNIKGNTFTNLHKGMVLNNLATVGGDLAADKNTFNNVLKGIYLLGEADIVGNDFLDMTNPIQNIFTTEDQVGYGVFAVGEKPRNIRGNVFEGSTVPGTNYLLTAAIVFEETGNALIQCTENTMSKTKVGIQVEGRNDEVGIFCNTFAADGNAHTTAGLRVVNNFSPGSSTQYSDGSLRDQGTSCLTSATQAGNEWLNTTGNNDIILEELFSYDPNVASSPQYPYFRYVYHSFDGTVIGGTPGTATQPKIDPALKSIWENLNTFRLRQCNQLLNQNEIDTKDGNSCIDFTTKSLFTDGSGVVNVNPTISDLIGIKANLELELVLAETNLINPDFQPDLVKQIKGFENQLQEVVMKLYNTYKDAGMDVQAKQLLETEDYAETKKKLIEVYYKEEDFVKSRQAQTDLENILNNKPDYYYKTIDEREAFEFNELYYKEINELLMQVKESNREENQLIYWEKYGLELIKESGLPVATKAEELLRLNNEEVLEHRVENPIINTAVSANTPFVYNMGVVPNPAMYSTSVLVNIPPFAQNVVLRLYDGYNNQGLLQTHTLEQGDNIIPIDVSNYISGLYTFTLEVDGVLVSSKHLVVIN